MDKGGGAVGDGGGAVGEGDLVNVREQMLFQMALLLFKKNTCAKLF